MPDVGPVITPPGQYTHCVDRNDYKDVPGPLDAGIASILEFVLCEYLLGGKLVCLAGGADECAVGIVVGLEAVGAGKKGLEALDNDFSFNVLLAPFEVQDFAAYAGPPPPPPNIFDLHRVRDDAVKNGPVGWLMVDSPNPRPLPQPKDQSGAPLGNPQSQGTATWPVDGYGVLWKFDADTKKLVDQQKEGDNLHKLWDKPSGGEWDDPPGPLGSWIPLPVLHAECEGSRTFFVCQAMMPFLNVLQGKMPGGGAGPGEACHAVAKWLPWPFDKLVNAVCSIAEDLIALSLLWALAPSMAAAFAAAWEAAQAFDDLFVTGPVAKQIQVGDVVIVKGRWTWDAGHSGHTELHPVKSIQKLMTLPSHLPTELRPTYHPGSTPPKIVDYHPSAGDITPPIAAEIKATYDRWCRLVSEAPPPPDPRQPVGLSAPQLASLSPEQLAVWATQNQPDNSWTVHPVLDGCQPVQPPVHIN